MKKISRESINEALKNYKGKITKLDSGIARNASTDGSVCAASFGSSLMGRSQSKERYSKEMSLIKERKREHRRLKRQKRREPATEKQMKYMVGLGIKFNRRISKFQAMNCISQYIRTAKELNKEIQKRIDLDS